MAQNFCHNCGSARDNADKFCPQCGSKFLQQKEEQTPAFYMIDVESEAKWGNSDQYIPNKWTKLLVGAALTLLFSLVGWMVLGADDRGQLPKFQDYAEDQSQNIKLLQLDRESSLWDYRTRIWQAYSSEANFGSNGTIALWGCGTECTTGVLVDRTTGLVVNLPVGGDETPNLALKSISGSNLLLAGWTESKSSTYTCVLSAFVWRSGEFSQLEGFPRKVDVVGDRPYDCLESMLNADDQRGHEGADRSSNPKSCAGASCRVLSSKGWAGIEAGMTVAMAQSASGLTIRDDGFYDGGCRNYEVVGGPSEISILVEDGIVTSITASGGNFRTDQGVKIGDRESDVRAHYRTLEQEPDPYGADGDKQLIFEEREGKSGVKFIVNSGAVTSITVGGSSLRYIEQCL